MADVSKLQRSGCGRGEAAGLFTLSFLPYQHCLAWCRLVLCWEHSYLALPSPSTSGSSLTQCRVTFSERLDCVTRPRTIRLCYCCCGCLRPQAIGPARSYRTSEFTWICFFSSEQRNSLEEKKLSRKRKFAHAREDCSMNIYSSRRE